MFQAHSLRALDLSGIRESGGLQGTPPRQAMERYIGTHSKEYRDAIRVLVASAAAMRPECRLTIAIPVAAHEEEGYIYRTLESFTQQISDLGRFEIVLLANHPRYDSERREIQPDGTLSEIARFQKKFPDLVVRCVYTVVPTNDAKIGYIRKLLSDVVVWRHLQREGGPEDHIIVCVDADTRGVDPHYVLNYIDRFDRNPRIQALTGQLDYDPESYVTNPLLYVTIRLWLGMVALLRIQSQSFSKRTPNFAYRASIYAEVGGYLPNLELAEDIALGKRIVSYCKASSLRVTPIGFAGHRSRLSTSSRRAMIALAEGLAPSEQWTPLIPDLAFSAINRTVRVASSVLPGADKYFTILESKDFISRLEALINRTLLNMQRFSPLLPPVSDPKFRIIFHSLGIRYRAVADAQIKITDATRLMKRLRYYGEHGLEIMERRLRGIEPGMYAAPEN